MFYCFWRRRSDDPDDKPKGPLTDTELHELEAKIAEAIKVQGRYPPKTPDPDDEAKEMRAIQDMTKKLSKDIDTIVSKVKKTDKNWYVEASGAVKTFVRHFKAEDLQKSLKSYKAKFT